MPVFITIQIFRRNIEIKCSKPDIRYKAIDLIVFRLNMVMSTIYKQYLQTLNSELSYIRSIK
jgi:hypothetical protein